MLTIIYYVARILFRVWVFCATVRFGVVVNFLLLLASKWNEWDTIWGEKIWDRWCLYVL